MKTKKYTILVCAIVMMLAVFVGCTSVNATEPTELDIIVIPEKDSVGKLEKTLAETLELKEIVIEESDIYSSDTLEDISYYEQEWMKPEYFDGMTDEEILAGFLQYEGGEFYERTLIAQIVMDRVNYEGRTLSEVLCDIRCFGIRVDFWEGVCAEVDEENLELARLVLEMAETNKDMTHFDGYTYQYMLFMNESAYHFLENFEYQMTTDNFVFFEW